MKPISRALALLCLLLSGTTLAAPATAYLQASQQLQQRIAQAADRGGMPRLAETETRQLLEILSDDRRFLQEPSYDASNLGELMEICGQANQAVMAYALFGLKEHLDAGAGPGDIAQQTAATLQRNAVAFQEELSYLQPFLLRCLARQIPPLSDFAAALPAAEFTPVRRAGLEQMRNGLLMAYLGPLQALADDSLSLAYRSALLQVLADTSTSLASPLPVAARRQIAELASRIEADSRTALPGSQAHLQTIIAAMRDEHCSGLCAL